MATMIVHTLFTVSAHGARERRGPRTQREVDAEEVHMFPRRGGIGESCGRFNLPVNGFVTGTLVDGEPFGIQETIGYQILVICVIAAVGTLSVALGLRVGIMLPSQGAFGLGPCLMLIVLFPGETWFCLDTMVQVICSYIWDLCRLGIWCGIFVRLGDRNLGLGGAPDGVGGGAGWLSGWTLFCWGWWFSWEPFVGTFLADVSKAAPCASSLWPPWSCPPSSRSRRAALGSFAGHWHGARWTPRRGTCSPDVEASASPAGSST